jgi:hypothetical protein
MAVCEKLEKCPFYQGKLVIDTGIGPMLKKKYCESDKASCARYMVATTVGPEHVTNLLFPNMKEKAEQIIAEVKNNSASVL